MSVHTSEVSFHSLGRRDWSVTWRRTGLPCASPRQKYLLSQCSHFQQWPSCSKQILLIFWCWSQGVGFAGHWGFHLFLSPPHLPALSTIDCMTTGLSVPPQGCCFSAARSRLTLCDPVYHSRGIDAFKLRCWRRLLRVPWTARRSNQSILKKISPEYSLEGLMLKLKLQYFGHLIRTADSLEKIPVLGKIAGRRRRGWQRMR